MKLRNWMNAAFEPEGYGRTPIAKAVDRENPSPKLRPPATNPVPGGTRNKSSTRALRPETQAQTLQRLIRRRTGKGSRVAIPGRANSTEPLPASPCSRCGARRFKFRSSLYLILHTSISMQWSPWRISWENQGKPTTDGVMDGLPSAGLVPAPLGGNTPAFELRSQAGVRRPRKDPRADACPRKLGVRAGGHAEVSTS